MKVYSFILCVVVIPCVCVNSKTIYNDRFGNDRFKSRYVASDDEQPMIVAEEPLPMPYGSPYMYQRVGPYVYSEYYQPRQKYRYVDERPFKRSDYQKRIFLGYDDTDRRQCRSSNNKRRSVNFAKQPYKFHEDPYYLPEANSMSRVERVERNDKSSLFSLNKQDDSETDEALVEEENANAKFIDDKYPSVLANFKIGSKLDKKSIAESNTALTKREFSQNDTNNAKQTDANFEDSETDGKVAEELRDILDYMGLIDEDSTNTKLSEEKIDNTKPDTYEDENMEEGSNKISLTKEERKVTKDRNKREESCESTESAAASSTTTDSGFIEDFKVHQEEVKISESTDQIEKAKRDVSRLQDDNNTLSGAKVRLTDSVPTLYDNSQPNEYEKRVERQIQNRINALKEEVKREIAALKAQEAAQAVRNLNEDAQRKKRQAVNTVNTLIDEENSDLDPALHPDGDLKPHIRRRRYLDGTTEPSQPENSTAATAALTNSSTISVEDHSQNIYAKTNFAKENISNIAFSDNSSVINASHSLEFGNIVKYADTTENQIPPTNSSNKANELNRKKREADYEVSYMPARHKRANNVLAGATLAFVPYRNEDDLVDEEDGEMEYDGFYDIVPNVQRKRQVDESNANKQSKSFSQNAMQNLSPYNADKSNQISRGRRQNYKNDLSSFHGGGPAENHMSAIRARSMTNSKRVRRRALDKRQIGKADQRPQTLSDLSDSDIFGALPQGYDGELNRFKRVKRNKEKG